MATLCTSGLGARASTGACAVHPPLGESPAGRRWLGCCAGVQHAHGCCLQAGLQQSDYVCVGLVTQQRPGQGRRTVGAFTTHDKFPRKVLQQMGILRREGGQVRRCAPRSPRWRKKVPGARSQAVAILTPRSRISDLIQEGQAVDGTCCVQAQVIRLGCGFAQTGAAQPRLMLAWKHTDGGLLEEGWGWQARR